MKPVEDLIAMLVNELAGHRDMTLPPPESRYYNAVLGSVSSILAGILQSFLEENNDWDRVRWIDDCLITCVEPGARTMSMGGIMIWGRGGTTEQWTDPFVFEIALTQEEMSFTKLTFWFGDLDKKEVPYGQFRDDRDCWAVGNRNWRYVIDFERGGGEG